MVTKLSEKQDKQKMKELLDQQKGITYEPVTDEDFIFFVNVLFGNYKRPGYNPE
jgi:hypothetical protein